MTIISNPLEHTLFAAQKNAINSVSSHVFPRYANTGSMGIYLCNAIHDSLDCIHQLATRSYAFAFSILNIAYNYLKHPLAPFVNTFYPINHINGERHVALISRKIEKFLGDNILFPLNTMRFWSTKEKTPYSNEKMGDVVDDIVTSLVRHNQELLNPSGETPFEYRMQTVADPDLNAFAIPGGKMAVFSQLVKEIAESIQSGDLKETKIHFADGTVANVNLEGVTFKDVLASLVGHEMTHIASRHSLALISQTFARAIFHLLGSSSNTPSYLLKCFISRNFEFEADVTGSYFAAKAGFDPRGALYLQELVRSSRSPEVLQLLEKLEFAFSHPPSKKRLCSLFTALSTFAPESLHKKVSWSAPTSNPYDLSHASPAVLTSEKVRAQLGL